MESVTFEINPSTVIRGVFISSDVTFGHAEPGIREHVSEVPERLAPRFKPGDYIIKGMGRIFKIREVHNDYLLITAPQPVDYDLIPDAGYRPVVVDDRVPVGLDVLFDGCRYKVVNYDSHSYHVTGGRYTVLGFATCSPLQPESSSPADWHRLAVNNPEMSLATLTYYLSRPLQSIRNGLLLKPSRTRAYDDACDSCYPGA